MANVPTTIDEDVPSYLQKYQPEQLDNSEFAVPGGLPIGVISIKGSKWKGKFAGNETVLRSPDGYAQPYFDAVLVKGSPVVTKTFYLGEYVEGSDDPPDCTSSNGVTPDVTSPHRQSETCGGCKWNKFNTARVGKGKRCQDNKRYAVLPAGDLINEPLGGPMLFRIPPGSFGAMAEYEQDCTKRGRKLALGVTRMSFDPDAAYPKIDFQWAGWLSEEEADQIMAWRDDPHVERVLNISQAELGVPPTSAEDEEVVDQVAPDPATVAREKVAAQRVARTPAAAPARTAPAARVAPAPVARPAPVAGRAAPVGTKPPPRVAPVQQGQPVARQPATVTPIRQPAAAQPVESPLEKKRRLANEALVQARAAAAELKALEAEEAAALASEQALEEQGATEAIDEEYTDETAETDEYTEEAATDEGDATDDFLDDLDRQMGSIPD